MTIMQKKKRKTLFTVDIISSSFPLFVLSFYPEKSFIEIQNREKKIRKEKQERSFLFFFAPKKDVDQIYM